MARILFVVVCVLGLLWAIGHTLKKAPVQAPRASGVVSSAPMELRNSVAQVRATEGDLRRRLATARVPGGMVKRGEWQRLSLEQRRTYAILATFFRDDPVMLKVAACESSLRHTLPDGSLNVGPDGHDVGAFMVRRIVHDGELRRYGLDPADFAHNVAFATHLYRRDGLRPWDSSRQCWETVQFL